MKIYILLELDYRAETKNDFKNIVGVFDNKESAIATCCSHAKFFHGSKKLDFHVEAELERCNYTEVEIREGNRNMIVAAYKIEERELMNLQTW